MSGTQENLDAERMAVLDGGLMGCFVHQQTKSKGYVPPKVTDAVTDLPDWMVKLARSIVRDCVAPGKYRIEFTVESNKKRIKTAVIMRVEDIRHLRVGN